MTETEDLDPATIASRRVWRRIGIGAGLVALGVTLACLLVSANTEARWRRARAQANALAQRLPDTQARRHALWGDTDAGNAWPEYASALRLVLHSTNDGAAAAARTLVRLRSASSVLDRRERDALLERMEPAFTHLRDGAHRDAARTALPRTDASDLSAAVPGLAALVHLRADQLAERNDPEASTLLLLDLLQFARDLMATPASREESLGIDVIAGVFDEFAANDGLRLARLPATALAALDVGLLRLDAGLPLASNAIVGDAADLVLRLEHDRALQHDLAVLAFGAWRYGFSERAMAACFLEHIQEHTRDCADAIAQADSDLVASLLELRGRLDRSSNPLTRRVAIAGEGDPRRRIHAVVRLRLLRLAAQYRQGRVPEVTPDPGGGVLTTDLVAGQFRAGSSHAGAPRLVVSGAR